MLGIVFTGLGIVLFFMILIMGAAARPGYRRERTLREDLLHDQIQAAMNWEPGFPPRDAEWDENNQWTDPNTSKVWQRMNLKELFDKEYKK